MKKHKTIPKLSPAVQYAVQVYKNTRNQNMIIKPDSWHWELYQDMWNKSFCAMKSPQNGISELMLISAMMLAHAGLSHFYVLPTDALKNRFISRIDKQIKSNKRFGQHFGNIEGMPKDQINNKSLKMYRGIFMSFIGSKSEANFTEFPAGAATVDEYDRCDQSNIQMVDDRLSDSPMKIKRFVSNPTIEGYGITKLFYEGDQRWWHIKCKCKHHNKIDFFKNVVREGGELRSPSGEPVLVCEACNKPIDRNSTGEWIADFPDSGKTASYQISQLFTTRTKLTEIYQDYLDGLNDPIKKMRFYNNRLGLPFVDDGQKITRGLFMSRITNRKFMDSHLGPCYIGVDVGSKLHYTILHRNTEQGMYNLIQAGWVVNQAQGGDAGYPIKQIAEICKRFNVQFGVIDSGPESATADAFKYLGPGFVSCRYTGDTSAFYTASGGLVDWKKKVLAIDRTLALDTVMNLHSAGKLQYPAGADKHDNGDLISHITTPTRISDEKSGRWVWTKIPNDHYLHTVGYALSCQYVEHQLS